MVISKRSRAIINLSKKLGHIPKGVTMSDLSKLKQESYKEFSKAPKKPVTMDDFMKKKSKIKKSRR